MALSVEDFERHARDQLIFNLAAQLDATAATYLVQDQADGLADPDGTSWVTLQHPSSTSVRMGIGPRTEWPTVEVLVPDLTYESFTIGQYDADAELFLVLMVWCKDARFPVLNRMIKRYASAVHATLSAPGALGDAAITRVRFAWRTDPEVPDDAQMIESGALVHYTLSTAQVRV